MGILLDNFQSQMKKLTDSEMSAFVAIDNRPEILFSTNLTRLANELLSSNSTVIRLTQKLGFGGFTEFRIEIKKLMEQKRQNSQHILVERYQYFFNDILSTINKDKLEYFAEKIHKSNNIFIVGLGLTKPIAEYMSKYLYQLDRATSYIYEHHMLDLLPNLLHRGDLVIFISQSGETKSLISCAKKVAETDALLLSFTNSKHNALNYITNENLQSSMTDNFYHNYDITSRFFLMGLVSLVLDIYLNKYLKIPDY